MNLLSSAALMWLSLISPAPSIVLSYPALMNEWNRYIPQSMHCSSS